MFKESKTLKFFVNEEEPIHLAGRRIEALQELEKDLVIQAKNFDEPEGDGTIASRNDHKAKRMLQEICISP